MSQIGIALLSMLGTVIFVMPLVWIEHQGHKLPCPTCGHLLHPARLKGESGAKGNLS